MSLPEKRTLVEPNHEALSISRQCELLAISRPGFYYRPTGETAENLYLMQVIDRPHQVWCADITYIPMRRGFLYLVAYGLGNA